jgi:hypothetical protein
MHCSVRLLGFHVSGVTLHVHRWRHAGNWSRSRQRRVQCSRTCDNSTSGRPDLRTMDVCLPKIGRRISSESVGNFKLFILPSIHDRCKSYGQQPPPQLTGSFRSRLCSAALTSTTATDGETLVSSLRMYKSRHSACFSGSSPSLQLHSLQRIRRSRIVLACTSGECALAPIRQMTY